MQPFAVLVAFPVLIGIAAQLLFGDAKKASCVATAASTLVVGICLAAGEPGGWTWLATLLVLPLPIALSLAAVILCYGRSRVRHKHHR